MANSNSNFQFLFGLLLLGVVLLNADTISSNDVVSTICLKTTNPMVCSSLLKSMGNTDLKGLANYTLNYAHQNVRKSNTLAKSLATAAIDPQLKERYSSCSESYNEAIDNIENAQKYLATGDFNGVNIAASGVMTKINDCQDSFEQQLMDTQMLLKDGKTLKDTCSIILVISNLLLKPM